MQHRAGICEDLHDRSLVEPVTDIPWKDNITIDQSIYTIQYPNGDCEAAKAAGAELESAQWRGVNVNEIFETSSNVWLTITDSTAEHKRLVMY